MLTVVLILTVLNLVVGFLALASSGRQFIERATDRDAAMEAHNALVRQINKVADAEKWHAEETQNLYVSLEIEREAR